MIDDTLGIPQTVMEAKGPFLTLYLDTEVRAENAVKELELRWRSLREAAVEEDFPDRTLETIDGLVDGAHRRGEGFIAIASKESVLLRRHLAAPVDDSIYVGPIPDIFPLLRWDQENPHYLVVLVNRTGADLYVMHAFMTEEALHVEGEADKDEVQKVQPGGWAQRRFQRYAENMWELNAKEVADEVGALARDLPLDFIAIAGDVRALGLLKEHLPEEVLAKCLEIGAVEPHDIAEIAEDLNKAISTHVGQATEQVLERFQEERGQHDRAAESVAATCEALRLSQVDTLIVSEDLEGSVFLLTGEPSQIAPDAGPLQDLGVGDVAEVPARAGLARAAVATGARLRAIPDLSRRVAPAEGVGALLRFALK